MKSLKKTQIIISILIILVLIITGTCFGIARRQEREAVSAYRTVSSYAAEQGYSVEISNKCDILKEALTDDNGITYDVVDYHVDDFLTGTYSEYFLIPSSDEYENKSTSNENVAIFCKVVSEDSFDLFKTTTGFSLTDPDSDCIDWSYSVILDVGYVYDLDDFNSNQYYKKALTTIVIGGIIEIILLISFMITVLLRTSKRNKVKKVSANE